MRLHFLLVGMLCLLVAGGCARREAAGLTLAGSTSVQPFAEKWAEVFRHGHGGFEISVQGGGSTAGVVAADTGAAQLGMCSRALKKDEEKRLQAITVARDAMVLIVHPKSTVVGLTLDQVRGLYGGAMRNWRDVGGADLRATVITREDGSGTRGAFEEMVMGKTPITNSALVQDSMGAVRQMVAADPAAIGYISLGIVDASVKALRIDGQEATEENIDRGSYHLLRPFLFVSKGEPTGNAKVFLDWILGPEGRALTRKEGLLPPKS
jgi:phosphate transport system substrate-binding protein